MLMLKGDKMKKKVAFSETVFTTISPEKVFRMADACLLEIRLVESRKEGSSWKYEYEVKGEFGRIEKFLVRIRKFEVGE